ncbi:MAG: tRNA (N6-threonylcarbamoyladenosine(37)-N6)-methyltransferase TrmO [Lachnospiraceae bacterium]|nr:tRNA (N6-threonylcarbamoyladenosine(37)-N6)-methyltransferase TrmO [Lachnospiraceae bacterium]
MSANESPSAAPLPPLQVIGHIRTDFPEKFGVPRQSGMTDLPARVVLDPPYNTADAFRGIEAFSHVWLLWLFDEVPDRGFSATVRPPKLGGNERVGVFATRSPFRPNRIGLSCVRLLSVGRDPALGTFLTVAGADVRDMTPLLDIKPYLPYADAPAGAAGGFAEPLSGLRLPVSFAPEAAAALSEPDRRDLAAVLALDPRPGYQEDPDRVYAMSFRGRTVRFRAAGGEILVTQAEP